MDPMLYKRYFNKLISMIPSENKKDFSIGDKVDVLLKSYQDKQKKLCESIAGIEVALKKSINAV